MGKKSGDHFSRPNFDVESHGDIRFCSKCRRYTVMAQQVVGRSNAFVFVIILTGCTVSSRPRDRADGALPMEFARGIDRAPRAQPARRSSAKQAYIEAAAMV